MNPLHSRPEQIPGLLTGESWAKFHDALRTEFDFCRLLQIDFVAAHASYFELDQETAARALIRCFGSLLEGITGSMRTIAIATGRLLGQPLNPYLQEKAEERSINAYQRIYTSYRLIGELLPRSPLAATTDGFWDELHVVIEIRNRVAHPKSLQDLAVTADEATRVAEMGTAFSAHVNQFAQWILQKEQKLIWEHMLERRRLYPKIGRNEKCPCGSSRKYKNCCALAALAA